MRQVRSENTNPELIVRRITYALGFRYRLHQKELPGKPDLVFTKKRKVIFVHGCFWHGHQCKRGSRLPKTNRDYWRNKLQGNIERDKRNAQALTEKGWSVLTIWECDLKDQHALAEKLNNFLSP